MDNQRDSADRQSDLASTSTAVTPQMAVSTQEQTLLAALERAEAGLTLEPAHTSADNEYLLVWLGASPYLVRLAELREALPAAPQRAALPFSPRWLWGIFPLRTELIALVDPIPMLLLGPEAARRDSLDADQHRAARESSFEQPEEPRALIVGEGDQLLGLLIDRIGDICALQESDQRPSGQEAEPGAEPLPRYITAIYRVAGIEQGVAALRMEPLIEDIFTALEEQPAHE